MWLPGSALDKHTPACPIPANKPAISLNSTSRFFANTHIMSLHAQPLFGLLVGDDTLYLQPRVRTS
jgi:hypothetical protein